MTASIVPANGWNLLGHDDRNNRHLDKAIVLHLSPERVEELKAASKIQLVTGDKSVLRFGKQSIDITIKQEEHANEIYQHSDDNLTYLTNATHTAILKAKGELDEALLALKQSTAQAKHQKQASQTHVASELVPEPKSRFAAAKRTQQEIDKFERKLGSPALSASTPVLAPTSAFHDTTSTKNRAIRYAIVHLLAMRPLSTEDVAAKIRLPTQNLKTVLGSLARQDAGKWQLTDKVYKDLDVWRFIYPTVEDRKAAIDHAVRAYDRLRLSKDDKLWQLLLPKAERNKGKILSRLHLGQSTMPRHTSPMSDNASSAVNSPRLGSQQASKTVITRLLSKDPKKARAAEEAKDKKRKAAEEHKEERAAKRQAAEEKPVKHQPSEDKPVTRQPAESKKRAAEDQVDRPAKRPATTNSKKIAKSQEFVYSSDDEMQHDHKVKAKSKLSRPSDVTSKAAEKTKTVALASSKQATTGKLTPSVKAATTNAHISPPKALRPTAPSPLGAVRPRVASDVSDRSGISQRRTGLDTPKGLGITTTPRKRHDTVTGMEAGERPKLSKAGSVAKEPVKSKPLAADVSTDRKGSLSMSDDTQNSTLLSQDRFDGGSSDSSMSLVDTITFTQGVDMAEKFRYEYYPKYVKLYDDLEARRHRGEPVGADETATLWKMHERLAQMKREINASSDREHRRGDES